MKTCKTTLLVAGVLVALFGLTPKAWAGGGSVGTACTLAGNPGAGAIALRGTAAAEAHNVSESVVSDVDLTLRLERGGVTKFFRSNNSVANFFGFTNEDVICTFISDSTLKAQIINQFGLNATWKLVLTDKSLSNASDPAFIGSGSRLSGIADVIIYAVRP
jgi:hypothetical protein